MFTKKNNKLYQTVNRARKRDSFINWKIELNGNNYVDYFFFASIRASLGL